VELMRQRRIAVAISDIAAMMPTLMVASSSVQ
jgi:hypothetical protein